jgi:hypothetical protein
MGQRGRIVAAFGAKVHAQGLIAPIYDVVKNGLIAALHVDGLENKDIHRVIHPTPVVQRCFSNVHDALIVVLFRSDFAISFANDFLVGAGDAEFMTVGEGLTLFDDDLGHLGE